MTIALGEVAANLIEARLRAGDYQSADDLVLDAIRALEERQARCEAIRAELNASLEEVAAALDRGEGIPAEQVFAEIRTMSRARKDARA